MHKLILEDKFRAQLFFNNKLVHLLELKRKKIIENLEPNEDKRELFFCFIS